MKLFIPLFFCMFTLSVQASQKGVTEEGDVVILSDDGTWFYENGELSQETEIETNSTVFTKPASANFALKSKRNSAAFALDAKQWKFKKNKTGDLAIEYTFDFNGRDLYGMVITEQVEIAVEELAKIAFANAKAGAPDAKVVKKEYRMVNGVKVIYMEMTGTIQSIKFKYFGYYYSDSTGSTQFLSYTGANLEKKYSADIQAFLNGFSVQQ